jgi:HrpA-like RNA helicase
VSEEMKQESVGQLVGYRVRFDEKLDREGNRTKIVFMTDGMLLREAILDNILKKYGVLVLDEVHERAVNSDVLLALVKEIAIQRKQRDKPLKLVVMSATLDLDKFRQYFGGTMEVVKVEGRTYPIEMFHSLEP